MISIWICIDYAPIMKANLYRMFEAFPTSIRSSSIDIVKYDVMFLDYRDQTWFSIH